MPNAMHYIIAVADLIILDLLKSYHIVLHFFGAT